MTVRKLFLRAAQAVLERAGRPMHYTAIAKAAIRMQLLKTGALYPEVVISSAISADISSNPNSPFRREKAGVFGLRPEALHLGPVTSELSTETANALRELQKRMEWASEAQIVRKGLYVLRRILDLSTGSERVTIEGAFGSFSLAPREPTALLKRTSVKRLVGRQTEATYKAVGSSPQSREISLRVSEVRNMVLAVESKTPIRGWDQTVLFALNILDSAAQVADDEALITLKGVKGTATIQLIQRRRGKTN
jgi:HB1/ASXL restriction endonuclease-like protein with HTH domain